MKSGDRGLATVEWLAGIAFVLVPTIIAVVSVAGWAERALTAHTIADEAARAAVLAERNAAVTVEAERVGGMIARGRGFEVAPTCPAAAERCVDLDVRGRLVRGGTITVDVDMPMPGLQLPFAGTVGGFHATVTVSERVDDHRSIQP